MMLGLVLFYNPHWDTKLTFYTFKSLNLSKVMKNYSQSPRFILYKNYPRYSHNKINKYLYCPICLYFLVKIYSQRLT